MCPLCEGIISLKPCCRSSTTFWNLLEMAGRMNRASMPAWRDARWILGEVPAYDERLSMFACFSLARDAPGDRTLALHARQLRKCGGYSLLSNFDDLEHGVQRIHIGFNDTTYKQVSEDLLNGTSKVLSHGTHALKHVPGTRLVYELGLLWAANARPTFQWYVSTETDAVVFPELLPAFVHNFAYSRAHELIAFGSEKPMGIAILSSLALSRVSEHGSGMISTPCRNLQPLVRSMDHFLQMCLAATSVPLCSAKCLNPNCTNYGVWAQLIYEEVEDFFQLGKCSQSIVGFHPVKDPSNYSALVHRVYQQERLWEWPSKRRSGDRNHSTSQAKSFYKA